MSGAMPDRRAAHAPSSPSSTATSGTGSGMSLVVLKGVQKTYRLDAVDVPSLVDIDLTIRANCFTVISGPSGSGKTTLLNMIGCIDRPDEGQILISGKPAQGLSDDG